MSDTTAEILKTVIQKSNSSFSAMGIMDAIKIKTWIGYNLYQFYKDGTTSGFDKTVEGYLKNLDYNDVLEVMVDCYLEDIKNKNYIEDEFEKIIKKELNVYGNRRMNSLIKQYIQAGYVKGFAEEDREYIVKNSPDDLLKTIGDATANKFLNDVTPCCLTKELPETNSKYISVSDFFVISCKEDANLNKDRVGNIVELMEGFRKNS